MKIDKSRPLHWVYLALFGAWSLAAVLARPWLRRARARSPRKRIVLYGHKLSGNLLAIHRYLQGAAADRFEVAFLNMDPAYVRALRAQGVDALHATRPACARVLARADAIVSDHGLHSMLPLLTSSDLPFFDVWHGIPFKGFDADDFRVQHRYREAWVASPLMARMYVERFGFSPDRVVATGYARTDALVRGAVDRDAVLRKLGIDARGRKLVLFAPTWKQDSKRRNLYPFGFDEAGFQAAVGAACERCGAIAVLRTHLNSGTRAAARHAAIHAAPQALFPDTEEILQVADVLICDWSSIAFDFLLLQRPTIFLEVEPPFRKGFSLGPEYRFGKIAASADAMLAALERYVRDPQDYATEFGERAQDIRTKVYGALADGNATQRCVQRLPRAPGSLG